MARFRIIDVDFEPHDLRPQVPFEFQLLRQIPGPDRPDYWLAALPKPLGWGSRQVTHLVLASRYVGQTLGPDVRHITLGIAYVTDQSLLQDSSLTFSKTSYVAIGTAERIAAT